MGQPLTDQELTDIKRACQDTIEDLVWLAACQDLTAKQQQDLEACEKEVREIDLELQKPRAQREQEHAARVAEHVRLVEEFRTEQQWDVVAEPEPDQWEIVEQ